jgi:hypothetical protein
MKGFLIKIGIIGTISVFAILSFSFSAQAEKNKYAYTLTNHSALPPLSKNQASLGEQALLHIIKKTIPSGFSEEKAANGKYVEYPLQVAQDDVNDDKIPDVILISSETIKLDGDIRDKSFVAVVSPNDARGEHFTVLGKKIFSLKCGIYSMSLLRTINLRYDGIKGLLVSTGCGGAYTDEIKILWVRASSGSIEWAKARYADGTIQELSLLAGASVKNEAGYELRDVDGDQVEELISTGGSLDEKDLGGGKYSYTKECGATAFKWDGFAFTEDVLLSKKISRKAQAQCNQEVKKLD